MGVVRKLEKLLALVGLLTLVLIGVLAQTSGATTPCAAVAHHAQAHLPEASEMVVASCLGKKGGGLAGLVVDLGLAVAGSSREKVAKRIQDQMLVEMQARLLSTSQTRCLVILAEGVVGRSNGGPRQLAFDQASAWRASCEDEDKR